MAWSHLQSASNPGSYGGNGSTLGVAYGSALSAGSVLIAIISAYANAVQSVSDGNGHSFTVRSRISLNNTPADGELSLWSLATPAGDAGTTPTITADWGTTTNYSGILIQEISGIQATTDGTPGTDAQNNSALNPAYTSSVAGEYLVAAYGDWGSSSQNAPAFAGTGYTLDAANLSSFPQVHVCAAYRSSTGGAEADGWAAETIGNVGAILGAFPLAAPATAVPASLLAATPPWPLVRSTLY